MLQPNPSRRGLLWPVALCALLVVLAFLQYRWIGEVSAAETERLSATAARAARLAARTFDEHIGDLFFALAPDLADRNTLAVDLIDDPELTALIDSVLQIDMNRRSPAARERSFVVRQWDDALGEFVEIPPDGRLRPLLRILRRDPTPVSRGLEWMGEVEPTLPALVLGTGPRRSDPSEPDRRVYVLALDRVALRQLAEVTLVREIAQTLGTDIGVRILDQSGRRLFEQPALPTELDPEARLAQESILAIRPSSAVRRARIENISRRFEQSGRPEPPWFDRLRRSLDSNDEQWQGPGPDPFGPRAGAWVLELWNPSGSLERLVDKTRRRNLLVGTAVLVLLGLATFQLWRSARTERATARRQMDFVAGITHELHTPLAAITSAGANLADGVVAEPQRIRDYGSMIQREGQRLNALVQQSLELAGIESGAAGTQSRHSVSVDELLQRAREATELICSESSVELRLEIADSLRERTVAIDVDLILRALANLISNSAKHGAEQILLEASADRRVLRLAVEDDGPGIPEADRRFLFEPYRRGATARGKGAGLGLYIARRIAEAHGGTLRFTEPEHRGARFELRLPMQDPPAPKRRPTHRPPPRSESGGDRTPDARPTPIPTDPT